MSSVIICPRCEKAFQSQTAEIEAITKKMMADGLIPRSIPEVEIYVGQKPSEGKCPD